ncbi:PEPxxWA-CTERM sorting domain-containing protein [Sphingomonas panacisoli]|nr:PEPxxWA-CTERM sorting domain-containing protein [Sphingomonas panacisoli]
MNFFVRRCILSKSLTYLTSLSSAISAGKRGRRMMKNRMLAAAVAVGAMAVALPAHAGNYIINFTTNQPLIGGIQTGSATITTSDALTMSSQNRLGYVITGISGMLNMSAITGLSGFQGSDNYFYTTDSFVDGSGLGFTTAGGTSASLYFASAAQKYQLTSVSPFTTGYVAATATPAVPEPATWAMMLIGFGAVGGALRRRKAQVAAVSFA